MAATVEIASDRVRAVVLPGRGAGLARFDALRDGAAVPLFRPWDGRSADPNALACYLLVPWSNRLDGGVGAGGAFHALEPTIAGERLPIHGWGWVSPWRIEAVGPAAATLTHAAAHGPYRYEAEATWAVDGPTLSCRLAVANRAPVPLPFGLGLHPWLPRTPGTRLHAPAERVWEEDGDHLPTVVRPVAGTPDRDFRTPAALPDGWINAAFAGWDGSARIAWAETGLALTVAASAGLGCYVLFGPGAQADFFCFEPVSHTVDAFNRPEGTGGTGTVVLEPGARLAVSVAFTAETAAAP